MEIKSYKDLIVWQKSFNLVKEIYGLTNLFPAEEKFGLSSQMRREVISIPSNIAEGYARKSTKEYTNFISIAYASGAELETQLLLAKSLKFISEEEFKNVNCFIEETMKMLNGLLGKLKSKLSSFSH